MELESGDKDGPIDRRPYTAWEAQGTHTGIAEPPGWTAIRPCPILRGLEWGEETPKAEAGRKTQASAFSDSGMRAQAPGLEEESWAP